MRIGTLLDIAAGLDPSRPIVTGGGVTLRVADLRANAQRLAADVQRAAGAEGSLCFVGVNSPALVTALFAADYAGLPFAAMNYRADEPLLRHYFAIVGAAAVITDERYVPLVTKTAPAATPIILSADAIDRRTHDEPDVESGEDPDDVALYVFTSGTTSLPRAVALRHRHLTSYVIETVAAGGEAPGTATLASAPPYHIATLMNVLTSVYGGRRLVLLAAFDPDEWLATADREQVTHAFVVPTMLYRILRRMAETGRPAPPALRTLAYGGAPASADVVTEALERFPDVEFVNAYGLSETSSTISVLGPEDHRIAVASDDATVRSRLGSAGRPLSSVAVRIAADREILVRGPQVSGEYAGGGHGLDGDGWFHTGDAGRLEDGYLYVEGRLDDMIIRGGENVSPLEVEEALRTFPGVRDAAVVGVSDREWGQRVAAAIEADAPVDVEALSGWLRERLPGFKCPERYEVVDALPRNDLGKVLRRQIRAGLEAFREDTR